MKPWHRVLAWLVIALWVALVFGLPAFLLLDDSGARPQPAPQVLR